MATQAELDVLLCPREYVEVPVSALTIMTRLKMAEYLDKKGKLIQVELGNIHIDILNDFTGLAKLADDEFLFTDNVKACQITKDDLLIP
ncbi:hypothetical protein DPMN_189794 [Dreissena polymorpha]|uniref:Uncharacterized protein n=1 Tax=Dreissena polymorpha TaxID=45954 RepID=A0A9D4IBC8_DREPO|nr:hypothetical protein DPMN_189794 [Dreissena polymorpha]